MKAPPKSDTDLIKRVLAMYRLPLRVNETADYAEIFQDGERGTASALTVQPSLIMLLNHLPAMVEEIEHLRESARLFEEVHRVWLEIHEEMNR